MHDDPLIDKTTLREFDPGLFTACGRALYLAQHFERNLKSIIAAIAVQAASSKDEETLNAIYTDNLEKMLNTSLNKILPKYVPEIIKEDFETHMLPQLDSAREARNRIAHEILLGVEGLDIYSTQFDEFIALFRRDIRIMAEADYHVCCMIQGFNREALPACHHSYVEDIFKWVFEPIDKLLRDGQKNK